MTCAPDPAITVKWPDVPACYGWLSLDRRGRWRLKGEIVSHAGLIAFINSRYGPDEWGNWIFSNGPQTVYVALEYTPLVLRLQVDGVLIVHTGAAAGAATAAYVDDEGNALLETSIGVGLLDDRDLADFLGACIRCGLCVRDCPHCSPRLPGTRSCSGKVCRCSASGGATLRCVLVFDAPPLPEPSVLVGGTAGRAAAAGRSTLASRVLEEQG